MLVDLHSLMFNVASKPLVLIRKVFAHLIRSSFCLFSQLGLIVFLSSLSIHFSLHVAFENAGYPAKLNQQNVQLLSL